MRIAVSEYFYSLQGEGVTMGIPAVFLRLGGCNLMCGGHGTERSGKLHDGATWRCDTIEVWMKSQSRSFPELCMEMEATVGALTRMREGAHLVITGGEPLLQQERVIAFLVFLESEFGIVPTIEVETNATIIPLPELDARVHYWNTSPKLSNSGMPESERIMPQVLTWFAQNSKTMSKLVINEESDWQEIQRTLLLPGLIQKKQIVLMPAAGSRQQLLIINTLVAEICIQEGLRMCTRLHVEIWDKLTGV